MARVSAEVARLLDEHGLGEHAAAIVPTAGRCAHLVVLPDDGIDLRDDAEYAGGVPVAGRSRFLGDPDLPPGAAWPCDDEGSPLRFVLQVDLAAVPDDVRGPLPSTGLLSLFVGEDEPAPDVTTCVLVVPDGPLVPTPAPPSLGESDTWDEALPARLGVVVTWDLPRWATDDHEALTTERMTQDHVDLYDEVAELLGPPRRAVLGRLFGHAAGIGHDPRHDAHVIRDVDPALLYDYQARAALDLPTHARRWRHLLTVDSCMPVDLVIWDAGYLQVLVRDDHLAELRFDHVYAAVESS